MTTEQLESLLAQGEGISIEFKQARHALPKDVFESVCAFLNRQGGHLILGAGNDDTPLGVEEAAADQLQRDFVTLSNNSTKLQPPFLLELAPVRVGAALLLQVYVPQSWPWLKGWYKSRTWRGSLLAFTLLLLKDE